jgi:hypothetical protein
MSHNYSFLFWVDWLRPWFRLDDNVVSCQKLFALENLLLLFNARPSLVVVKSFGNAIDALFVLRLSLEQTLIVRVCRLWEKVLFALAKLSTVRRNLWWFILRINFSGQDRRALSSWWLLSSIRLRFFEHHYPFIRSVLWSRALIDWSRNLVQACSCWYDWVIRVLWTRAGFNLRDVNRLRVDSRLTSLAVD